MNGDVDQYLHTSIYCIAFSTKNLLNVDSVRDPIWHHMNMKEPTFVESYRSWLYSQLQTLFRNDPDVLYNLHQLKIKFKKGIKKLDES